MCSCWCCIEKRGIFVAVPPSFFLLSNININIGLDTTLGASVVPASKEWMVDFANEDLGCTGPSEDTYKWREAGYGSNMNCESEPIGAHATPP